MKKTVCLLLAVCMVLSLAACGAAKTAEPVIKDWSRSGYFTDENENMLSVTYMDDIDEPGWYVGCMLGEDFIEDSWGGTIAQEGNTLHGTIPSSGSRGDITVTISEEGDDGLLLTVEGGETYHFTSMGDMTASIIVTINTDGRGMIGYEEGETAPELDPEWPYQSAQVNLAEPETYTFAAAPETGYLFVKWTKNGAFFSDETVITVLLDESADFVAVFEEDSDWQNPVMNFIGDYQCDRAGAHVECIGKDEARITIEWGSSAWELARWDIVGRLDMDTLTIEYSGVTEYIVTYDDSGEIVSQVPEYENGTGTIIFNNDGTFTWHEDQSEYGRDMVFEWIKTPFAYEHDPRENPGAMADIVENPDAVYGFSPDPESTRLGVYAEYDWTDPEFVAEAQKERRAYHESMDSMTDIIYKMREEGASVEEIARAVSEERNRLRLAAHENDPEGLAAVKESNLETYGHEEGPTPDELFKKYGSWTTVLQKAFSSNMGMDACCGLYDEYYWLYIELGYVGE